VTLPGNHKLSDVVQFTFGTAGATRRHGHKREAFMKTLVIGLVITIVFLATYFVSTMQRVW
jgi:hypothetical protein